MKSKDLKLNPQELAVNEYLAACQITFDCFVVQELKQEIEQRFAGENKVWECDEYLVKFTNNKGFTFKTDYRCGIGHRFAGVAPSKSLIPLETHKRIILASKKCNDRILRVKPKAESYFNQQWLIAPTAASVLHSLFLDSSCGESTFHDFCSDFGYNEDSRKAMDVYLACQKTHTELRGLFSHAQREKLQEILQDY